MSTVTRKGVGRPKTKGHSPVLGRDYAGLSAAKIDEVTLFEDFSVYEGTPDRFILTELDGTAAINTAAAINYGTTAYGNRFGFLNIGTNTAVGPVTASTGLDLVCDDADNDGMEMFSHAGACSGRPIYVGTDPGVFFRVKFQVTNVSGSDDFHIGWRFFEPASVTVDDYADRASLGWVTVAASAALCAITENTAGAGTEVETALSLTLADATTTEWQINVDSHGNVTYLIDGVKPSAALPYRFTAGLPIHPYIHYLHANADQATHVYIIEYEVGWL